MLIKVNEKKLIIFKELNIYLKNLQRKARAFNKLFIIINLKLYFYTLHFSFKISCIINKLYNFFLNFHFHLRFYRDNHNYY